MNIFKKILKYEQLFVLIIIPVLWFILYNTVTFTDGSYWFEFWWMFPVALTVAIIVNTVGISGAALFVPFFVLIFPIFATPLSPEQSVKLGLITESFGLSSSALAFLRYGLVDKKIGLYSVLTALPLVIIGAVLSFFLPVSLFRILIAIVLLLSVYMLLNHKRKKSKFACIEDKIIGSHHPQHNTNVTVTDMQGKTYKYCRCGYKQRAVGYGVGGFFQGVAGFGIGELGIVSMLLTNIPIRIAIGTSHVIVATTAVIASLTHVFISNATNIVTPWNIIAMTVPAVIIGGQLAPYISTRIKAQILEYFVAGLFVVLAGALILLY